MSVPGAAVVAPIAPAGLSGELAGHVWTLAAEAKTRVRPPALASSEPWSLHVTDPDREPVRIGGELRELPGADTLLVVLHGLGGSAASSSSVRAAAAAERRGWSSLRLTMRGADGLGEDVYHGGLVADIAQTLDSSVAERHERLLVLGASAGGHIALRHALEPHPRLAAVVAISPPLDLEGAADALDRGRATPYRRAILRTMKRCYRAVAARRPVWTPVAEVMAVSRVRDWDGLVVAPRFGFRDAEDYYASMSVGPELGRLAVPSLYLGALGDPMIPFRTIEPALSVHPPMLDARILRRGGHLGFPVPIEDRALEWLDEAGSI